LFLFLFLGLLPLFPAYTPHDLLAFLPGGLADF
jgi:hypothetical protein